MVVLMRGAWSVSALARARLNLLAISRIGFHPFPGFDHLLSQRLAPGLAPALFRARTVNKKESIFFSPRDVWGGGERLHSQVLGCGGLNAGGLVCSPSPSTWINYTILILHVNSTNSKQMSCLSLISCATLTPDQGPATLSLKDKRGPREGRIALARRARGGGMGAKPPWERSATAATVVTGAALPYFRARKSAEGCKRERAAPPGAKASGIVSPKGRDGEAGSMRSTRARPAGRRTRARGTTTEPASYPHSPKP